eukprot:7480667-Alexandrium_andersonii.AAC.1
METYLKEVVFCIIEDHNSRQWRNPRGNLAPFQEAFDQGVRERRMPAPDAWESAAGFKQAHRGGRSRRKHKA